MSEAVFVHALHDERKDTVIGNAVGALRAGSRSDSIFRVDPRSFAKVPGAPFAYWASEAVRDLFQTLEPFEGNGRTAKQGLATADDFRFVRAWWEVSPDRVVEGKPGMQRDAYREQTFHGKKWVPFAKGGEYSQYYADIHLVVDWERDGEAIKQGIGLRYPYLKGKWEWVAKNPEFYFRPGLTWSRRTQGGFSVRPVPPGCIFSDKGPVAFSSTSFPPLLGLMNSAAFRGLVALQMAFGSYEVGVIQRTPVPDLYSEGAEYLGEFASTCIHLKSGPDICSETSHRFLRPALVEAEGKSLEERFCAWTMRTDVAHREFQELQGQIDGVADELYGGGPTSPLTSDMDSYVPGSDLVSDNSESNVTEAIPATTASPGDAVADLLSYALGCVYRRWDVRLVHSNEPREESFDPFGPLPACAPGALDETQLTTNYPIPTVRGGILVDDVSHVDDVVQHVRGILAYCFADSAEASEQQMCQFLGIKDLRSYLSNPRGFFDFHIKRYSKSRRKAPIYWLLLSQKRSYGLWLYYHRLDRDTLFKALTLYVEPKIRLEQGRLEALTAERAAAASASKEARQIEKAMERQEAFLADLHDFHGRLKRAADLNLVPDLDDGVVLTMAPLWELVPWREPKIYWDELLQGKYEWSSIGNQLRKKRLVRA